MVKPFRILVAAVIFVGVLVGLPGAALASIEGQVEIGGFAKVGRFGTAIVTLRATCTEGATPKLDISVVQPQGTHTATGTSTGSEGLVCDGRTHRLQPEVDPRLVDPNVDAEFQPGPANVRVRLTLRDPNTGDVVRRAFDSRTVNLLPPVEVRIGFQVKLNAGGSASVPVLTRCQRPWVEPDLVVEVTQFAGTVAGTAAGDFGIVCDAQWHRFRVRVVPSSPFVVGQVHVLAFFDVLDPIDFDPVGFQAVASVDRRITRW